jgi:broad specificity phosphatase PhoE
VAAALERVRAVISRLLRKHSRGTVALVVPEPIASMVVCVLTETPLGDLWKAECEPGGWRMIEIHPEKVVLAS